MFLNWILHAFGLLPVQGPAHQVVQCPGDLECLTYRGLQGLRWSRCLVYLDYIILLGGDFMVALDNLVKIIDQVAKPI